MCLLCLLFKTHCFYILYITIFYSFLTSCSRTFFTFMSMRYVPRDVVTHPLKTRHLNYRFLLSSKGSNDCGELFLLETINSLSAIVCRCSVVTSLSEKFISAQHQSQALVTGIVPLSPAESTDSFLANPFIIED